MNCCNPMTGKCEQGHGCPARTNKLIAAANERIRQLEAQRLPLHIRVWDWAGNLPHRLGRWVDRTNLGRLFCLSVGVVLAGGMAVSLAVGWK